MSHLICGGVYDWSTGLIYKGGRYFDPNLGIWLALAPLVVVQSWKRRKKKGWQWPGTIALALFLVGVSGMLVGCEKCKLPEMLCVDAEAKPFGPPLNNRACFVNVPPNEEGDRLVVLSRVVSGGTETVTKLSDVQLKDWTESEAWFTTPRNEAVSTLTICGGPSAW